MSYLRGVGLALCSALVAPAVAQDDTLSRAERHYRAGQLVEAEPLFASVLTATSSPQVRRTCYEHLLSIHTRLGRADRAVGLAGQYRDWLGESDPARRRQLSLELARLYANLGHFKDADRCVSEIPRQAPVGERLQAFTLRAQAAEALGQKQRAAPFWKQLEELSRAQLARQLESAAHTQATWALAASLRGQQRAAEGVEVLVALLRWHDAQSGRPGKLETLRRLADLHTAVGSFALARTTLQEALDEQKLASPRNQLLRADLHADLARVALLLKDRAGAEKFRLQAIQLYHGVRTGAGSATEAFFKLQALLQATRQFDEALKLSRDEADQPLIKPRLFAGRGGLALQRNLIAEARPALETAVAELNKQEPLNLLQLPRAQVNLAQVLVAGAAADQARTLANAARELYRRADLPDDVVIVDALGVLGSCSALHGNFREAMDLYEEGLKLCVALREAAVPHRAELLLKQSLLYKAQGEIGQALQKCLEATTVYRSWLEPDDPIFVVLDAARANLHLVQGDVDKAQPLVESILKRCQPDRTEDRPLLALARYCQGLDLLARKEYAAARTALEQVRAWQAADQQSLLLPRTLNYLGLAAELLNEHDKAKECYRDSLKLQKERPGAFPATRFITHWRLAELIALDGDRKKARAELQEGIAIIDRARLGTYGDPQKRAGYFAQFAAGLEKLVEWCVLDKDYEAALVAMTQSRSRTLLDQLLTAEKEPLQIVGAKWRTEEEKKRQHLATLRARAQLLPTDAKDQAEVRQKLLQEFDAAQQDYAEVWGKILSDTVYGELANRDLSTTLPTVLREVLQPGTGLLVYHLGRTRSYALLASERLGSPEVFPLHVPLEVAERAAPPPPQTLRYAFGLRGASVEPLPGTPVAPVEDPNGAKRAHLTNEMARILVEYYVRAIAHPGFRSTQGLKLDARDPAAPLSTQRLELLADVFFPLPLRERLKTLKLHCLVVVPDGALHRLPLEGLLLRGGARARYLLDETPPLVYAPSPAILGLLAQRPLAKRGAGLSLLTVGNPAYRQPDRKEENPLASLLGQLPLLPGTKTESRQVRSHFDENLVLPLEWEEATEAAVTAGMRGRNVLHLAAHGLADDHFGNLFGALILTPPKGNVADTSNDGFLSLHEISRLPLKECELAVLSACMTNVGPQLPQEAGVTLANGFLTAGARRVVASHWSVDDRSTAELMSHFFAEVTATGRGGNPLLPAQALRKAQLRLRHEPGRSAPFFWASFVVIGPPDASALRP